MSAYRDLLGKVIKSDNASITALLNAARLANTIYPGRTMGDTRGFLWMIQSGVKPRTAARICFQKVPTEKNQVVTIRESKFQDDWDKWRNDPDTYDEERENRL